MSSVENAKNFVVSWNDPELRRFAEEYAAEQTLGFAQLAIDQAEQIKRLQEQIDNTALVNEDGLTVRVERVRKTLLDEGVHPTYHRQRVELLRKDWPTLYHAIMGLVKP